MEKQNFDNPDFTFVAGILSVFLCVVFGSNAVAIKLAFVGLGVFTTAAIRFSIAALAIFIWARVTGKTIGLKKGQLHQVLILAALFVARRFYPLNYRRTAMLLALAAGMIPALFMQVACMYDPSHILLLHVLPGLSMVVVSAALASWWRLPR